jgi:serine/threonine protein phosphatase PrpC
MSVPLYIHGGSDVGRQRQQNEDCFRALQRPDGSWVLVVCDGMGGHEAGEVASAVASQRIVEVLASSAPAEPPRALYDALVEANRAVLETARARGTPSMGTTAVAAWVLGTRCYVGWVGDSRLYHFRQGQVIERSRDHTRVEQMVQHGILTPEQAKLHPDAHVLLRALGGSASAHQDFRPEVWNEPLELRPGDVVLLCSDGLYDLIEDAELYPLMERHDSQGAVERLIQTANERGGNDNITAVLLVAGQPQVPATSAAPPMLRRDTLPDRPRVIAQDVLGASALRGEAASGTAREASPEAPGTSDPRRVAVAAPADASGTAGSAASEPARAWPPGGDAPHLPGSGDGARAVGGMHPPSVAASPAESRHGLMEGVRAMGGMNPPSVAASPVESRPGPMEGGGTRRVPMMWALSSAAGTLLIGGLLGWWLGRDSAADAPTPTSRAAVTDSPAASALLGTAPPAPSTGTSPVAPANGGAARVEQTPSAAPAMGGTNVPSAPAQPSAVAPSVAAPDGGTASAPVAGDAGSARAPTGVTPPSAPAPAPAPAPKPKKKAGDSDPKSSAPATPAPGAASGGQGT